eukprot:1195940-Prorocentrum_minimum.AAC.3
MNRKAKADDKRRTLPPRTGIFSLPFRDWCPLRAYSLSPSAIGARYGHILSPLPRLVPATGVFSRPSDG